jgi:predicted nucleic acid-binding protein
VILIDTDICIEILNRNERVIEVRAKHEDEVAVCFMSIAELYYGSEMSIDPASNNSLIDEFLLSVNIIQTDLSILKKFGELKSMLRKQGHMLPDADILIAASAYQKAGLLVTGNIGHFDRFPNLRIENWIQ